MSEKICQEVSQKMSGAIKSFEHELKGLRTGRASVHLLEPLVIEAYGDRMNISQVGSVSTPDARTITIQVWDKSLVKVVEKAIIEANLGVTPNTDGQVIRLSLPLLTEERRKELVKLTYKYGENAKIACRNVRRDGNEELKKLEKNSEISKDDYHTLSEEIQKLTDNFSNKIDELVKGKEQEVLKI